MSSLKRILCSKLPEPHRPTPIEEKEANHAIKVLRLKDGDLVEALDGKGHSAIAKLRTRSGGPRIEFYTEAHGEAHADSLSARATESGSQIASLSRLTLEVAILKGDAMEWVVEKAVELGVSTLVPVITAHTVVQVGKKGPEAFQERWQKIADQALKQCGRLESLKVETPIELESLLARKIHSSRLWCNEVDRTQCTSLLGWLQKADGSELQKGIHLLIGPEGGWSELERTLMCRQMGMETEMKTEISSAKTYSVSLGPLVLRAETAAIYSASLITAVFRDKVS
jgi:16S rRNA (uracil1498-N3)-methyltransferase